MPKLPHKNKLPSKLTMKTREDSLPPSNTYLTNKKILKVKSQNSTNASLTNSPSKTLLPQRETETKPS